MDTMSLLRLPDDFTVWAFADPHGVRSGLDAALRVAGLLDVAGHWSAPPRTALVGCGDYIDRGTDSAGLLELLFRLRAEAAQAGSQVVLAKGNHEAMLESILAGRNENLGVWLSDFAGGLSTAISLGLSPTSRALHRQASDLASALIDLHPELPGRLRTLPDAIIWRDVLFTHAGPVPNFGPDDLGAKTTDHLWQVPGFDLPGNDHWNLDGPAYQRYRAAGLGRYVFGHESHDGPAFFQGGRALGLDTNASYGAFGIRSAAVSLARIPRDGSLVLADFVEIDTRQSPDRQPR